jgi:hypothetical protein
MCSKTGIATIYDANEVYKEALFTTTEPHGSSDGGGSADVERLETLRSKSLGAKA